MFKNLLLLQYKLNSLLNKRDKEKEDTSITEITETDLIEEKAILEEITDKEERVTARDNNTNLNTRREETRDKQKITTAQNQMSKYVSSEEMRSRGSKMTASSLLENQSQSQKILKSKGAITKSNTVESPNQITKQ